MKLHWPILSISLLMVGAFSAVCAPRGATAESPEQSWPWVTWERPSAGLVRWPELDSDAFDAWKQFEPQPATGAMGPASEAAAAVYLVPKPASLRQADVPGRIELPRLDNRVRRVWWWPLAGTIDGQGAKSETASELRTVDPVTTPENRGDEYTLPFVPPVDRLLGLTQSPTDWFIGWEPMAEEAWRSGRAVIVIDLLGEPSVGAEPEVIEADSEGTIVLPAAKAKVSGTKLQFEPLPHKNTIGYWVDEADRAHWRMAVSRPATYRVSILQGCGAGQGGSQVAISIGNTTLEMTVEETGHFQSFRRRDIGVVTLDPSDGLAVEIRCVHKARAAVMDVREIRLTPEPDPAASGRRRDVRRATPDVTLPPLTHEPPVPGRRSVMRPGQTTGSHAYHLLTLPTDWQPGRRYPVLVEWTGNGPYENRVGDSFSGRVEDATLAHGLSGGDGWIVLSLPFLNQAGTANVRRWWGDPPGYDPETTLRYAISAMEEVCEEWGGDRSRFVLVGFSRGSIAASALGLSNEQIAGWWRGMVCFSHLDGVRSWPPPATDPSGASQRWQRLGARPLFVLAESAAESADDDASLLASARRYLSTLNLEGDLRFAETGFINHSDRWSVYPSPVRDELRTWLKPIGQADGSD